MPCTDIEQPAQPTKPPYHEVRSGATHNDTASSKVVVVAGRGNNRGLFHRVVRMHGRCCTLQCKQPLARRASSRFACYGGRSILTLMTNASAHRMVVLRWSAGSEQSSHRGTLRPTCGCTSPAGSRSRSQTHLGLPRGVDKSFSVAREPAPEELRAAASWVAEQIHLLFALITS